jgi:hypothetical protein
MEDLAKTGIKDYKNKNDGRLDKFNKEIGDLGVELVQSKQALAKAQKGILSAQAVGLDNAGTLLNTATLGLVSNEKSKLVSNALAVITGGRVGTVRPAGQNAATNVRNNSRTGK